MGLQFLKADTADAVSLVAISRHAFDSDVEVGGTGAGGPPGYDSLAYHAKMARMGCLYKLTEAEKTVGGAILFANDDGMNVGRIFVAPECFRKGYGIFMMQQIEEQFPKIENFTLDTPIWNVRTNAFYRKLGYTEVRRDNEFVYYEKRRAAC